MNYISENTDFKPLNISTIGKGASACVYKVNIEQDPYSLAVKYSSNAELLKQEYEQIKFINDRVDCKMPRLYHFGECGNGSAIMIMELFDGISAAQIKHIRKASKVLPDMIVDNLLKYIPFITINTDLQTMLFMIRGMTITMNLQGKYTIL